MSSFKEILKDKDRRRGIIGTTLVHLLLIVALLFLALRTPLPLPGEEGVEVNLGYDDIGMGDIQTESPPLQAETPPPIPQQEITEPEPVTEEEDLITQEIEETPVIEEEKVEEVKEDPEPEEIKEEIPETKEEIIEEIVEKQVDSSLLYTEKVVEAAVPDPEPEPVVNEKALFTGSSQNTSGTNQGIAGGAGDQGKPHGFEDSQKYDGQGGLGNGISFSLGGRGSKFLDKPSANFKEQGTVKVDIWVDRNGNVKNAAVNRKGTNIIDPAMHQIAINAAKNSTFAEDPKALELQRGSITYNFILMK